ncbi:hypothetical protein CL614_03795 [archaeon]|nr:hypothetical protein [archaeon]|tara:strand:+ start:89 stop:595 length:507 start_codon:yes stop_codon:yes gene_type:complete
MVVNIKIIGWKRSEETANMLIKSISGFFVFKRTIYPSSYVKIDQMPILDMSKPEKFDYLLVLDPSEADLEDYKSMKEDGVVIVNTVDKKMGTSINNAVKKLKAKIVVVDVSGSSIEHTGRFNPSIGILAAFVKKTNVLSLKNLETVIKESHKSDGSLAVAEEVHKLVK